MAQSKDFALQMKAEVEAKVAEYDTLLGLIDADLASVGEGGKIYSAEEAQAMIDAAVAPIQAQVDAFPQALVEAKQMVKDAAKAAYANQQAMESQSEAQFGADLDAI